MTGFETEVTKDLHEAVTATLTGNPQLADHLQPNGPKVDNVAATAVLAKSGVISDLQIVEKARVPAPSCPATPGLRLAVMPQENMTFGQGMDESTGRPLHGSGGGGS